MRALVSVDDAGSVATAATDENREVRIAVANGLAKLSAGGEAVRALVHDGDPLVRAAALTALGELGVDDEILHAVEQALKAPAWQIRQGAVRALAGRPRASRVRTRAGIGRYTSGCAQVGGT